MAEHGGFDHQRQTYRILTELEQRYPDHPGLNLTYEVLEGVVKHDTDYDVVDATHFHPEEQGTLECQLSNLADEIAYSTSDFDDGLRSGILNPAEVRQLGITQMVLESMGEPNADLGDTMVRHRFVRRLVGIEVTDTATATEQCLAEAGVRNLADLRRLPTNAACYSPKLRELNTEMKQFLYKCFYRHYRVVRMATKADRLVRELFQGYSEQPLHLPPEIQRRVEEHPEGLERVVCDYIAGMTDRFAVQEHRRLFDPEERA